MSNQKILSILKFTLFVSLLAVGFTLAAYRPLWNDEVYSQISSVGRSSYAQIITGQVPEGNVSPLFYLLQKAFQGAIHYGSPGEKTGWSGNGLKDQLVLRTMPVIFMSAAIAGIFYFFSRTYSLGTGALALFLALSTPILWGYWAEARPYALWVYLTAMQSLVFLRIFQKNGGKNNAWAFMNVLHILLALTIVFSLPQILLVSLMLGCSFKRKWTDFILLTIVPTILCLYYYAQAPKYPFWLDLKLEQYIRAGMSRERLYIVGMFAISLAVYFAGRVTKVTRPGVKAPERAVVAYFIFVLGMLASVAATFIAFKCFESPRGQGFPVMDRYFIHLAPIGVIAATLFIRSLFSGLIWRRWLQWLVGMGIGYLLIHRLWKVIPEIAGHYPHLFKSGGL